MVRYVFDIGTLFRRLSAIGRRGDLRAHGVSVSVGSHREVLDEADVYTP